MSAPSLGNADSPLTGLRNIGNTVAARLHGIGINTEEELRVRGPAVVYRQLRQTAPDKTWPLCYYLYSLEGALTKQDWRDISEPRKAELQRQVRELD